MDQKQAISKLKRILGQRFGYRVDPKAPDAEKRGELLLMFEAHKRVAERAEAARIARREELFADPLYQELKAKAIAAKEVRDLVSHQLHSHRITVGLVNDLFFSVRATGDTWAEVVEKVCAKEPACRS